MVNLMHLPLKPTLVIITYLNDNNEEQVQWLHFEKLPLLELNRTLQKFKENHKGKAPIDIAIITQDVPSDPNEAAKYIENMKSFKSMVMNKNKVQQSVPQLPVQKDDVSDDWDRPEFYGKH